MAITLSDNEGTDHESKSEQVGNFMAFIAVAVVGEIETVDENPTDGELSENTNLQEAYNKLCKIAAKDAMNVDLGLKKIETLEREKKNLLVKLFDANKLIIAIKIENVSFVRPKTQVKARYVTTTTHFKSLHPTSVKYLLNN